MLHFDGTVIAAISELSQSDYRNAVLTDLMAGKSISGNPSGIEGKLKSLKSAFHDIPGQVTSFTKKIIANPSELFHSAKGIAAIMVVVSLIATVLYYVVIGALKLTAHLGEQPA